MTREEMIEAVAQAISNAWDSEQRIFEAADAAIAIIRAETLEEAAKVAETCQWWESELMDGDERGPIAAAIRALKTGSAS